MPRSVHHGHSGPSALRGGLAGLAALAAAVAMPGWAVGLSLVLVAVVVLAQTLLPQESADRLAWWEARWNRRSRHRRNPLRTGPPRTRR